MVSMVAPWVLSHVICFIIRKMPVQDIADQMACMSRFNEDLISLVSEAPIVATTAVVDCIQRQKDVLAHLNGIVARCS